MPSFDINAPKRSPMSASWPSYLWKRLDAGVQVHAGHLSDDKVYSGVCVALGILIVGGEGAKSRHKIGRVLLTT